MNLRSSELNQLAILEFIDKVFTFSHQLKSTEVKTEKLSYPLPSLVAEFEGTLGLFLGFSFITHWGQIDHGTQTIRPSVHQQHQHISSISASAV